LTSFIETEKELVSVERVSEYIDGIPMEKQSSENDENEGPEEDSTGREGLDLICRRTVRGRLSFIGVNFAYSPGMPLALRDVTFDVDPGQRVAIIGRTGLCFFAIFRFKRRKM
jgi:ABC-type multidrug transport system fused ATPase/permease subunit